ncbi:MAG: hypothetical protein AB7H79_03205, partial [Sphingomonas sp.]
TPPATAQRTEGRSDAQLYFDAERRLQRAEDEATCAWYPTILHRIINLRTDLRRLERFADRNGALRRLQRAAPGADQEAICFGVTPREITPWLQSARRDTALLQQRLRRAGRQDPNMRQPGE